MQVRDALSDYLADIKHLEQGTQISYQQRLIVFADWATLQGLQLEQINNKNVQAFLVWLLANHKPSRHDKVLLSSHTTAGYVRCVWAFLYWCIADEEYGQMVKLQVVKGIKMPRQEQFIKRVFTDAEIVALFEACQHESKLQDYRLRDTAILSLLVDTGIRAQELRTLIIGNVVLSKGIHDDSYIIVMGKGHKQREIPLGKKSRRALSSYLRECRAKAIKTDIVFLSRYNGMMSHEALKDILQRLRDVSTLPRDTAVNPHRFRHTFASRFMAGGGDVYDLSRLMGHTSVIVTELYLKSLSTKAIRTRKNRLSVLDDI